MTRHRSTAYVKSFQDRGRCRKLDPITAQFRFIIRMAVGCNEQGVPYDVAWSVRDRAMSVTITAAGSIPTPKPLRKPPKLRFVSDWHPAVWDAEYQLEAWYDSTLKRLRPGFVITHSCGLSLVHPSESGELGGDDEDIRQNWLVAHTASGRGFGLTLSFKRAACALSLAASFPVDWMQDSETFKTNPEIRRAGNTVLATYGTGFEKDSAKRRLEDLERAA